MASHHPRHGDARKALNAQLAVRALELGSGVALHRPAHVYLQVASACNLDCYMCSEHNRPENERHGRGLKSMPLDVFEAIERDVFPWSRRTCIGVGGEPTIAPRFTEYVERAARAGQEIHLTTNGTRFDHGRVAEVVAKNCAHVFVSIDAATAPTYERIRRGSQWNKLRSGMQKLRQHRETLGARSGRLTLAFVLMRSNVHELPAFVELAREWGADSVQAQHVIAVTNDARGETLFDDPAAYNQARERAVERARALGIHLDIPAPYGDTQVAEVEARGVEPFRAPDLGPAPLHPSPSAFEQHEIDPREVEPLAQSMSAAPVPEPPAAPTPAPTGVAVPCRLPVDSVFVLYDGRVYPCCHPFAHSKMKLGDLRTQTFGEIWNGRVARNLRAGLRRGDVPTICRNCSVVHSPPPSPEDPDVLAASQSIAEYYADRDLDPVPGDMAGITTTLALMERSGLNAYSEDLRQHADQLERRLAKERDRWTVHVRTRLKLWRRSWLARFGARASKEAGSKRRGSA